MAPLLYPDEVEEVFDQGTDIAIQNFQKYWDEFGSDIDIVYICGHGLRLSEQPHDVPRHL